jgi:hypothetical protein
MSYETPAPAPYDPPDADFKLEAVIVCDRYHDFLRCTLPTNKFLFDRIVVVTSYEDKATRRMCEFHHVECVPTDALQSRKGVFCKAEGINEGLAKLSLSDWVVHMDADIFLPPQTRILIQRAGLAKRMIYGVDRFMVKGARAWNSFLEMPKLQHENECYVHTGAFPLGTRVMQINAGGYIPIGFFQLWNAPASGVKLYPSGHSDAGRTDGQFAMQWPRALRAMIPEIIAYHLESVDSSMAANWGGRTTAPFTLDAELKS